MNFNKIMIPSSDEDSAESDDSWIHWFCQLEGHEFLCEIDREYITDNFNLYGLRNVIPNYKYKHKQ
jgi:casein kinase II subunit beta